MGTVKIQRGKFGAKGKHPTNLEANNEEVVIKINCVCSVSDSLFQVEELSK